MYNFKLKFSKEEIGEYADRYNYNEKLLPSDAIEFGKHNKYLSKSDFLQICEWKSARTKHHCVSNNENYVKEVTETALTKKSDQLRIEILTLLKGVSWPTASVILHFCHELEFPILDFRALYSLGYDKIPKYDYQFWKKYTEHCRSLSNELEIDLRTLDKALWQYSKENQIK